MSSRFQALDVQTSADLAIVLQLNGTYQMQSEQYITERRLNQIKSHYRSEYKFGGDSLYTFVLHARESLKSKNVDVIQSILTRSAYDFNLYIQHQNYKYGGSDWCKYCRYDEDADPSINVSFTLDFAQADCINIQDEYINYEQRLRIPNDINMQHVMIQRVVEGSNQEFYGRVRIDPRSDLIQSLRAVLNELVSSNQQISRIDTNSHIEYHDKPLATIDFQQATKCLIKTLLTRRLCSQLVTTIGDREYEGLDPECEDQETCSACQAVIKQASDNIKQIESKFECQQIDLVKQLKENAFRLDHDLIIQMPEDARKF